MNIPQIFLTLRYNGKRRGEINVKNWQNFSNQLEEKNMTQKEIAKKLIFHPVPFQHM